MLLAPFSLLESSAPRSHRTSRAPSHIPTWLLAWLAIGVFTLLVVPAARGGGFAGYSLPFWLLGAPLINVLWLGRSRWLPLIRPSLLRPARPGSRCRRAGRRRFS